MQNKEVYDNFLNDIHGVFSDHKDMIPPSSIIYLLMIKICEIAFIHNKEVIKMGEYPERDSSQYYLIEFTETVLAEHLHEAWKSALNILDKKRDDEEKNRTVYAPSVRR